MKNIKYILILIIGFLSCKSQDKILVEAELNKGIETGKCYFSVFENNSSNNDNKENGFVLELVPPKFIDTEVKLNNELLKKYSIGNNKYRIPIREWHTKFVMRNESLARFTKIENSSGFLYCLVEVPAEYKVFSMQELIQAENKVVQKKVAKDSKIIRKYVNKRPNKLLESQYYFENGKWSKLQEANSSSHEGTGNQLILQVKIKLIELDYKLVKNNELDKKTKEALIDFQQKNNLKEGQLDSETLNKLGIKN